MNVSSKFEVRSSELRKTVVLVNDRITILAFSKFPIFSVFGFVELRLIKRFLVKFYKLRLLKVHFSGFIKIA